MLVQRVVAFSIWDDFFLASLILLVLFLDTGTRCVGGWYVVGGVVLERKDHQSLGWGWAVQ